MVVLATGALLAGVAAWWWLSMRAREQAVQAARRACRTFDVQLLDETVALRGLRPVRDRDGRLRLRRLYQFEFTRSGSERHGGHVALLGQRLMDVHLEAVDEDDPTPGNRMH
jgi:hypothetical protein